MLVVGDNSYRPLQSLQWRAQGTASKRALLIGSPHSSQIPNLSCRIRVKVSSMARKSLLSACLKRTWTEGADFTGSHIDRVPTTFTAGGNRTP